MYACVILDSFKAHDDDITQIEVFNEDPYRFATISKDKLMKIWTLPEELVHRDILNSYTLARKEKTPKNQIDIRDDLKYNDAAFGGHKEFDPQKEDF